MLFVGSGVAPVSELLAERQKQGSAPMNRRITTYRTNSDQHKFAFGAALKKRFQLFLIASFLLLSGCLTVSDNAVVFRDHLLSEHELRELSGVYLRIEDKDYVWYLSISDSLGSWSPPFTPAHPGEAGSTEPAKALPAVKFSFQTGNQKTVTHYSGVAVLSWVPGTERVLATVPAKSLAKRDDRTGKLKPYLHGNENVERNLFFTLEPAPGGLTVGAFTSKGLVPERVVSSPEVLSDISNMMKQPEFVAINLKDGTFQDNFKAQSILAVGYDRQQKELASLSQDRVANQAATPPQVATTPVRKPIVKLDNPHGWYEVSSSGIAQITVTRHKPSLGYDFVSIVHTSADPRLARRNQKANKGTWHNSLGNWVSNDYMQAVSDACGRETYGATRAHYLEPVFEKGGVQRRGIYRFKNSSNQRFCRIGNFNGRTCAFISCAKWSDHPDYKHSAGAYLVRDLAEAKKLFENMESWSYNKHGVGSVPKTSSQQSGNGGYSASEDARQSTYDAAIDLWLDN
ncbi:hypothetical protein [Marinobacter sp. 1_MG-2023]|uniref:hypothetical protein n=1 Tax=Marinobacter sp. 1_MG-2023 TaxID=3062627 RepID=UPI0026E1E240|nr:hypothetical protein [Marinobacter sp. 1_MG-2023]MDO6822883.1 hypothetical protein [Marinobacter sp. 1_MG-2023]